MKRFRSRSRFGRRRFKRRNLTLAPIYKTPFPEVERVVLSYSTKYALNLSLGANACIVFGPIFNMNDCRDPNSGSATVADQVNANGFDQLASRAYLAYYVPRSEIVFRFRRSMLENGDNIVGRVGYLVSKDSLAPSKFEALVDFTDNGTGDIQTVSAGDLWKKYPGMVYRRFGTNDSEMGRALTYTYSRNAFINSEAPLQVASGNGEFLEVAVGRRASVGAAWTSPTERAVISPFFMVDPPVGYQNNDLSTEAGKNLEVEVYIKYYCVFAHREFLNSGAIDHRLDTSTNNG